MAGLKNLQTRLEYLGGDASGRINKAKKQSLTAALSNSYQSTKITVGDTIYPVLINPDRLQPDYDNKVISAYNEYALKAGSNFYWADTNTYWLVYLQELNETAYFRGYIRRCETKITIDNTDYYVYLKGPSESDLSWNGGDVPYNDLNHTLNMYITKDDKTLSFFDRFVIVQINGHNWQVQSIDEISMPGVIEIALKEHYDNPSAELQVVPTAPAVNTAVPHISGPAFVKPYSLNSYTMELASGGTWSLSNTKAVLVNTTDTTTNVEIRTGRSGTVTLSYTVPGFDPVSLLITIESI